MSEKKRRTCQICGRPYVPTSNVQKYCPDCRDEMKRNGGSISDAYKAYKMAGAPGPVRVTQIETPETHLMDFVETRDYVGNNEEDEMNSGNGGGGATGEPLVIKIVETPKQELPADLAFVEESAEILRRYYKGELVDKNELLAEICEKLGNL